MDRPRTHQEVYVVLPGRSVQGHWHDVEFVTQRDLKERKGKGEGGCVQRIVRLADPEMRKKFWVSEQWEILSTEEVLKRFADGVRVKGRTGPHDSDISASDCVDAAWESPGG